MDLKEQVRARYPRFYQLLRTFRYAAPGSELDAADAALVARLCGGEPRILAGPFAGMRYLRTSGSGLLPKLAGCYERELQPAVEESLARGYDRVVNVGSGEGYYAVGYALRLAPAPVLVHAFDLDILCRQRLRRLARLNGVAGRLRIGARCGPLELARLCSGRTLVVCDCEGCELDLLDPDRVPRLAFADLLVELHDFVDPAISATFVRRFAETHDVTLIPCSERTDLLAGPLLAPFAPALRERIAEEGRPAGMRWGWARSRCR
jgi:hypothetical protein